MSAAVAISLLSTTHTKNDMGDPVESLTPRAVMADKVSVRQSEFYQAMGVGLRAEAMFVVMTCEYQDEVKLRYNSKDYNIIRTYDRPDERTELICSSLRNDPA